MKLSTIEKEVLQYVIENSNGSNCVGILLPQINQEFVMQAVENLDKYGLVTSCNTLCGANAILTQKGFSYFEDLEREEYGELYESIKTIKSYIKKAYELKTSENIEDLKAFIRHTFLTYSDSKNENAIHGLKTTFGVYAKDDLKSFYYDLDYIIMMLTKIKDEKCVEAKSLQVEKIKIENNIYNENKNVIDIKIDLIQVFNQINESKELSSDEKVDFQQLINDALKEKNKNSLWEKIKNIFGKVTDKTFDVAVAILPILTEAMLKAKGML